MFELGADVFDGLLHLDTVGQVSWEMELAMWCEDVS